MWTTSPVVCLMEFASCCKRIMKIMLNCTVPTKYFFKTFCNDRRYFIQAKLAKKRHLFALRLFYFSFSTHQSCFSRRPGGFRPRLFKSRQKFLQNSRLPSKHSPFRLTKFSRLRKLSLSTGSKIPPAILSLLGGDKRFGFAKN